MPANRVIGVDVGGTKIAAGVVDRIGVIERRREVETPTSSEDAVVDALFHAIDEQAADLDDLGGIGIGVPSTIDQAAGRAISSVNIPLDDVPLRELVSDRYGVPCGIDNDANAAAIAEWQVGVARGAQNVVMLTLGTGVGGGLVLDGRPYRGSVGAAAELGHIVVEHEGRPCQGTCTGRGHLEAYATGLAASADARAEFGEDADSRTLLELAGGGDARALTILAEIAARLGSALGTLVNVFDPEVIVIGGGFGEAAAPFLLDRAVEVMRREALPPARDHVRVVAASLGGDAGLVGAAFVGFEAADARGAS